MNELGVELALDRSRPPCNVCGERLARPTGPTPGELALRAGMVATSQEWNDLYCLGCERAWTPGEVAEAEASGY